MTAARLLALLVAASLAVLTACSGPDEGVAAAAPLLEVAYVP